MSNLSDAQALRCNPFFTKRAFQPTPQPAPPQMGGVDPNAPAQGDPNAMPPGGAPPEGGMPQIDEQTAQMLMAGQLPPGMDEATANQLLAQLQGGAPPQGGDPNAQQAPAMDPQVMQLLEQQNQQIQSLTDGMVGVMNTVKELDGKFNDVFDNIQLQGAPGNPRPKAAADERTLIEQAIPVLGAGAAATGSGMLGGKVLANLPMAFLRALGGKRGFKKFRKLEAPGFNELAVENFKHLYNAPLGGRSLAEAATSHLTGLTAAGLGGTAAYKGLDGLFDKKPSAVEHISNPDFLSGLFS